jgi:hypothetical protein
MEQRVTRIIAALACVAVDLAIDLVLPISIARVTPSWIEAVEHRSPPRREETTLSRRRVSNGADRPASDAWVVSEHVGPSLLLRIMLIACVKSDSIAAKPPTLTKQDLPIPAFEL